MNRSIAVQLSAQPMHWRNVNQAVSMMKKETDKSLDDYKAYSRRYHIAHILYVDQDKELTKIDISDDSVLKMPVPEF